MQFFVVIPVFNAGAKIAATLASIFDQTALTSGRLEVSVVVVDGASTDDTLAHAHAFEDERLRVISEPDRGMYDALAKGLAQADGDVTCYLPAGERFDPNAFDIVATIFAAYSDVHWLTGRSVTRNAAGHVTDSFLPHPFRRSFIDCGMYGTRLPAVQQESTFWRTKLTHSLDFAALRDLKLAGDYFMWRSFAAQYELYVVNSQLAAFTIEPGQLSQSQPGAYRRELRSIRRKPRITEQIHALLVRQYTKRVRARNTRRLVQFDHGTGTWHLART